MGITGLLPLLKPHLVKKQIASFKNKTIGIDGHSWLYQISLSISTELFYSIPTTKHLHALESKIKTLVVHKIKPIFVFDGSPLPSKESTNTERREKKEKMRQSVLDNLKRGNISRANDLMRQCVSISSEILWGVVCFLRKMGIEYIISPYESDAQLCYLQRAGLIDCILTEDSDMIVYGCTNVLYKYDGSCVDVFVRKNLEEARDTFFRDNILDICILSGCDYLPSIKGIGVLSAYRMLKKAGCWEKAVAGVRAEGKKDVPVDYEEEFRRARKTFMSQVVYDPIEKERRFLCGSEKENINCTFLGSLENEDCVGFAAGNHLKPILKSGLEAFLTPQSIIPENKTNENGKSKALKKNLEEIKYNIIDYELDIGIDKSKNNKIIKRKALNNIKEDNNTFEYELDVSKEKHEIKAIINKDNYYIKYVNNTVEYKINETDDIKINRENELNICKTENGGAQIDEIIKIVNQSVEKKKIKMVDNKTKRKKVIIEEDKFSPFFKRN